MKNMRARATHRRGAVTRASVMKRFARFSGKAQREAQWIKASHMSATNSLLYYGSTDPPPTVTTGSATVTFVAGTRSVTLAGTLDSLGGLLAS